MKISINDSEPYITKDGSLIIELIHPCIHAGAKMSLAMATVEPGSTTVLHIHAGTQEIYHILEGYGRMTLGGERFEVNSGDSILILAGTPHCIENIGLNPLKILCCCNPPYDHQDTLIMQGGEDEK